MTQPNEAVGGEAAPAELTPEDRLQAAFEAQVAEDQEEEEPAEADEGEQSETDERPEVDEEAEDEPEIEADDLPPIDAPSSWTAEEKAKFAELPRDVQETVTRREAERERFVQTKAQEAAQAHRQAAKQAAEYAAQVEQAAAEQLTQYAQMLDVAEPDPSLVATNPALYAQQMQAYRAYAAQRQAAQQQAQEAHQRAQQYQAAIQQQEQEAFHQRLSAELPEFFDANSGPKLKEQLTATAKSLGFSDDEIFGANATQILALKRITDLQAKADKYDALMRKQMERVRAGKSKLPPVSKPGAAKSPGATINAQYQADREAMRRGDKDAATRVLDAFFDKPR